MAMLKANGMRYLLVTIAVLAAFALGFFLRGGGGDSHDHTNGESATGEPAAPQRWTCSMHPQIILPSNDQKCPICFMDLIPLDEGSISGSAAGELTLSDHAAALADVATEPVQRRFIPRHLRLVGKVSQDETRTRTVTARVAGRLDKLYVDATGQRVRTGDPVADIYSPELYSAQAELRAAAQAAQAESDTGALAGSAQANLDAAIERLRLWGLGQDQIDAIVDGQSISDHVTVTAPTGGIVLAKTANEGDYVKTGEVLFTIADLGTVWATLQAFETDVAQLREGQDVAFTARAYAGRTFPGLILFVDPVLDERTRTVEVRVEVDNMDGLLKPGMLIDGRVEVLLDAQGLPVADTSLAEAPLVIPASAPLLTGSRAVVYVRKPGEGDPVFGGRQVTLGPRVQDHYLVLEGLKPGEMVVTRGNFKIDSALQILAEPSMMNPVDDHHDHRVAERADNVPPCFGEGLNIILAPYYELQEALAGDDDSGSATAAGQVVAATEALNCDTTGVGSDLAGRWHRSVARLRAAASVEAAANDIAERRQLFEPLSDLLWEALESFGTGTSEVVRRFHCPMAFDNEGAFWIQSGKTTANPYYGEMMLRCGEQKAALGEAGNEGS